MSNDRTVLGIVEKYGPQKTIIVDLYEKRLIFPLLDDNFCANILHYYQTSLSTRPLLSLSSQVRLKTTHTSRLRTTVSFESLTY